MREMCNDGVWTKPSIGEWDERLKLQLKIAYTEFKLWCRRNHIKCSQSVLTPRKLSLRAKKGGAVLKAKAYNCLVVCAWLSSVAQRTLGLRSNIMIDTL